MRKVWSVAVRDFKATVFTKAFLLGALIPPLLMVVSIPLVMLLINNKPPPAKGTIAIIDRANTPERGGGVGPAVTKALSPESLRARLLDETKAAAEQVKSITKTIGGSQAAAVDQAMKTAEAQQAEQIPQLRVELLPALADADALKQELLAKAQDDPRLAVVIIAPDAVLATSPDAPFGAFELFVRAKTDMRLRDLIRRQVREAVVNTRLLANHQDPARIAALTRLDIPEPKEVTVTGEQASGDLRQVLLPVAFMVLMWISVFAGGQMLLTSTIEEKSNRIMEVLLSALSPMELMTGKILGQMAASLTILCLYGSLGISSLFVLNRSDLFEGWMLVCVVLFFFIGYFVIASMMAAIGSAVNDLHEANALMTPVMLVVMLPMILMMPIIMNPGGRLATILSFTPLVNPFVMVLRMASTDPPPLWQIALSMLVGIITAYVMLRLAAKIFRIGVLMYGKAPNLATLLRWIKMA